MKEYMVRFLMMLATCVGLFAFMFGFGWLITTLFNAFGIWGVLGLIAVLASAFGAAMPMHGGPPR